MRLTFVVNSVGINGGGRAVFECANRLHDMGHQVSVVYPLLPLRISPRLGLGARFRNLMQDIRETARRLFYGKGVWWFPVGARVTRVLSLSPKWVRLFKGGIPDGDAVIATAWETAYTVNALGADKGRKFYFVQHYEIWDAWNSPECWAETERAVAAGQGNVLLAMAGVEPPDGPLKGSKELVDATYRLPLKKITTSRQLGQLMEEHFGEKANRVMLGVNQRHFYPESAGRGGGRTVAMPYRRYRWKGEDDGVRVLELVRERRPETRFILYGAKDRYLPEWLRAFNRGQVYGEDLRRLYNEADVFVFTSWVEGWALPPMEAMACGTACVTTNVGAVMDYAVPGRTAVIVEPRSPERMAEAVIGLLNDGERMLDIARGGYEAMKRFSWNLTATEMEKILYAGSH